MNKLRQLTQVQIESPNLELKTANTSSRANIFRSKPQQRLRKVEIEGLGERIWDGVKKMGIEKKKYYIWSFREREKISCGGRLRRSLARDSVRGRRRRGDFVWVSSLRTSLVLQVVIDWGNLFMGILVFLVHLPTSLSIYIFLFLYTLITTRKNELTSTKTLHVSSSYSRRSIDNVSCRLSYMLIWPINHKWA